MLKKPLFTKRLFWRKARYFGKYLFFMVKFRSKLSLVSFSRTGCCVRTIKGACIKNYDAIYQADSVQT